MCSLVLLEVVAMGQCWTPLTMQGAGQVLAGSLLPLLQVYNYHTWKKTTLNVWSVI